jgi:hypothetical protein
MNTRLIVGAARVVLAASVPLVLTACSAFSTTTDGIAAGFGSTTDGSRSTTPDSKSARGERPEAFVRHRFEAIRFEAARGEGENIDTLAVLLGERDRAGFGQWMKRNYATLFADLRQPVDLLTRIEQRRGQSS